MTTDTVVEGWRGLATCSSSLAVEKEGESDGSSFRVTLAGRAGSRASMGAMIQWDSRHSSFTLQTETQTYKEKEKRSQNIKMVSTTPIQRHYFYHTTMACEKARSVLLQFAPLAQGFLCAVVASPALMSVVISQLSLQIGRLHRDPLSQTLS